jgi:hypothetical protein
MANKELSSQVTDRIVTVEQLLNAHDISLEYWEIEKQIVNSWEVGAKTPDGTIATTPLFQVKVWLRSKIESKRLDTIKQEFIDDLKALSPIVKKIKYTNSSSKPKKLVELNIFDLHLGKFAWHEETNEDYDLKIAIDIFNNCIDHFIDSIQGVNVDKFLLPIGNDFFNSDYSYPFNRTTKGTPQENDTRWQHIFRKGRQLLIDNINKLTQIAPVDIVMIPGNHDYEKIFYLGDSLEGWFSNNENVNVNNIANPRKYYKYGNILLGFTHGDKERINDLPLIMAQENPMEWGTTKHREFHLGHIHHKQEIKYKSTHEYNGVIIRYMSSLAGNDAWHHSKGYVGSKRSAECLVWDSEKGLDIQIYYTL